MKIYYDGFQRPEPSKVYLATPYHKILCALNGIKEETFNLKENLNNAYEISFDIDRFIIDEDGNEIESNGYNWVQHLMRIYVDNVGWFICSPPSVDNDGIKETKTVSATSCEIEMVQHDVTGLKINCGTTDSYEMLVEGNVDITDEVEFAKNPITFCNKDNPELSLLHILLKVANLHGWTIGHIDNIPKEYKNYIEGKLVTTYTALSDEKGTFDIEAQDLYSLITQDLAQYFNCIFVFDIKNLTINAYRPENIGKNTNINIGFRNLQNSNSISIDENNIFTVYTVSGADDLGITYVNGGTNKIENIEYFLNEKYLSDEVIGKYKLWQTDLENIRPQYIEQTRLYNAQLDVVSELKNRLPLDDCSTDWKTFDNEALREACRNYISQLKGYESFYVDENDEFDEEALINSVDYADYMQIKEDILPSILIEYSNRYMEYSDEKLLEDQLFFDNEINSIEQKYTENNIVNWDALEKSSDSVSYDYYKELSQLISKEFYDRETGVSKEPSDYEDNYKTNWELYGLDELQVKLDEYQNTIEVAKKGKYDVPYTEDSGHTEDYHNAVYAKYLDAVNQLDANYEGSCQSFYNLRQSEIDEANAILEEYNTARKNFAKNMDKATWQNGETSFSSDDLVELSKIYVDNTYSNENMFLLSSDTSVTAIDEQLKLLEAAKDDLSAASQPQFTYATNLDNFLAQYEYRDYTNNLNLGDFVWLGVRDDYVVKLRVISISYNPLVMDNNLEIEFSNMIRSRAKRDDFTYLLGGTTGRGKSSSSGSGGNYVTNEGIGLTSGLISKLLANGGFKNTVNQWIENSMAVNGNNIIVGSGGTGGSGGSGNNLSIEQLNENMIKVVDIVGENAFFEYLQTKLISTDKIVADSGVFKDLFAEVASIDELNAKMIKVVDIVGENAFFEYLQSELIDAKKVVAENAVFQNLEALVANIDKLLAGDIAAELAHVINLTTKNVTIEDAVIADLIAARISVGMLKASTIDTDDFNVVSKDGGLKIVGNTMQFSDIDEDGNETVRIQIGRDNNDEFTFTLYDAEGKGVLIDNNGIHESAITDGLIKNEMIAEGTILKDKLGFPVVDKDENGNINGTISITNILDGSGGEFGAVFTEMQNTVAELSEKIEDSNFYNIILGHEYQVIPCVDGFAKYQFTIDIPFTGYIGTTQVDTVAVIGTLPHGVTLAKNQAATPTTDGLISLVVAKDADFGGSSVFTGKIPLGFTINGVPITKNFTWSKTNDGAVGVARVHSLESTIDIIVRRTEENGTTTLSPSEVTFSAHIKEEENRGDYSGRFIIQTSIDGLTYNDAYVSNTDEWTVSYTPNSDVNYIKCSLCKSGSTTAVLAVKTVTVLDDSRQLLDEIFELHTTISQVSSVVDENEKAIKDRVWTTDISSKIDEYDGSTIETIRDTVTEHTVSLGQITSKVSDVETKFTEDTTEITEKISEIVQDVEGFKQTVSETYATNEALGATNSKMSTLEQTANEFKTTVTSKFVEVDNATTNAQNAANKAQDDADKANAAAKDAKDAADTAHDVANEAKDGVAGLVTRVTNAETAISQKADSITLTATKEELISTVNNTVSDAVSNVNNTINNTVNNAVNNIEIGGKNMLRGTATGKGWSYSSFDLNTREFTRSNATLNENYISCDNRFDLEAGQKYTLSFKVKQNGYLKSFDIFFLPATYSSTGIAYQKYSTTATTEYTDCVVTFTPASSATSLKDCTLRFDNNGTTTSGSDAVLYIKDVKLEKGNKATDYTVAPEDVDTNIQDIKDNLSGNYYTKKQTDAEIKATADAITSKVTSVETDFSDLSERVKTAEEKITDDAIIQTVSSTYAKKTEFSELSQTVSGISGRVGTAEGKINTLELNSQGFTVSLGNLEKAAVVSTVEEFYPSTSPTELSGGFWRPSQPQWATGVYIWRRTLVTYGNGDTEYTPSEKGVCITGNTGASGQPGYTPQKGIDYFDGAPGKGIAQIHEKYGTSANSSTQPTQWYDDVQQLNATDKKYLWNYEIISYSDGSPNTETKKRVIGVYGDKGQEGYTPVKGVDYHDGYTPVKGKDYFDGEPGRGISEIINYYLATSASSDITRATSGWSTNIQTQIISADKKYLWNYEEIKYTKGDPAYTTPTIIGVYGDKGEPGYTPIKGKDYFDGQPGVNGQMLYATCGTASNVADKTATLPNDTLLTESTLKSGTTVSVKFTYANTVSNPKLKVGSANAKPIYLNGAPLTNVNYYWTANAVVTFVYDSTNWNISDAGALLKANEAYNAAHNYMRFTDTGLCIGDHTASTLGRNVNVGKDGIDFRNSTDTIYATYRPELIQLGQTSGRNLLLDGNGLAIRNGTDAVASFGESVISLGKASTESYISLCGDIGRIKVKDGNWGGFIEGGLAGVLDTLALESESVISLDSWSIINDATFLIFNQATIIDLLSSTTSNKDPLYNFLFKPDEGVYANIQVYSNDDVDLTKQYAEITQKVMCTNSNSIAKITQHVDYNDDMPYIDFKVGDDRGDAYYASFSPKGFLIDSQLVVSWRKELYNDGLPGVLISEDGAMHIQNDSAPPSIDFYLKKSTSTDGQISVNQDTGYMEFLYADGYKFDNHIRIQNNTSPYIDFYLNGSTTTDGTILVNQDTGHIEFLHADGYSFDGNVYLPNNRSLFVKNTDDTFMSVITLNNNNNTLIGYSGYELGIGNTNLYGNGVNITSKNDLNVTASGAYFSGSGYFTGTLNAKAMTINNLRTGRLTITPSAANTPTGVTFSYGYTYNNTPRAVACPETSVVGTAVLGVSVGNITTTSCNLYLTRTNTTATPVNVLVFGY